MSTRSTIYYNERRDIHVYRDYMDDRCYIEHREREYLVWDWFAYAITGHWKMIEWPLVTRKRYERDLKEQRDATLRAETKASLAELKAEGRDSRPYDERQEGTITIPVSAAKIAWDIAKDRRDAAFRNDLEKAEADLDALHEAGFDSWIPTLSEVRGAVHSGRNAE